MEEDKQNPEHRSNKVPRRQAPGSSSDSSDVEEQRGREELIRHHRDKSFTTSGSLKIHQRVQTGEKPYSCDHCEKTFLRCSALKAHQRIHTEGELSSFLQSGKDFTESGTLKKQDIDTAEKLFSCDQCEKAFTCSGNLKTHKRSHTGEKPYSCDQCGKAFTCSVDQLVRQYVMWERTIAKKYILADSVENESLMNLKFDKLNLTLFLTFLMWVLKLRFESMCSPRYLYSVTTCTLSPETKTSGITFMFVFFLEEKHTDCF
ncbi:hypothetical protein ABVT39_001369 [Epinephelus coioides]